MKASILLAGQSSLANEALQYVLMQRGYIVTTEKVGDFSEIQNSIRESQPDIVIWDDVIISNCFKSILNITHLSGQGLKSVLILNSRMLHFMAEGLLYGIKGFIHKKSSMSDLNRCLNSVSKNLIFVSPQLTGKQGPVPKTRPSDLFKQGLTQRELTILKLVSQNKTSKEIADILYISYRTVQNHRQNICYKLGLKGRNKLYKFATFHFEFPAAN